MEATDSTSTRNAMLSGAAWIASADVAVKERFLSELEQVPGALLALPYLFEFWAHPHQLPPEGDWRNWVCLGGRGAGKTRAGAEWVRSMVEGARPLDPGKCKRIALVGETVEQVREVMIFGDSGIMACSPPDRMPEWKSMRKMLQWPNGAVAVVCSAHNPETLRGPQFDSAWFTEIGCAAVDKATNEPNKFIDPKSSESVLPNYSNGLRDELIQRQYVRAVTGYWSDPDNNPVSDQYGGPMIDLDRVFVWAWDARPYPWFPNVDELWSDGPNYRRGHWLNGRVSGRTLASVVCEICLRSGLETFDVSELYGFVRGYLVPDVADARRALQPLMMTYGFDAIERNGVLIFRNRSAAKVTKLETEHLALHDDLGHEVTEVRSSEAEMSGRVRLNFVEADGDYRNIAEESVLPDQVTHAVAESEVPLLLARPEGRQAVERWLSEARVSRDAVRLALPMSMQALGAGDVIDVPCDKGRLTARIDRVEQTTHQLVDAVRIEPSVYEPAEYPDDPTPTRRFVSSGPVLPLFMDLPLMRGDEVPHAPHIAIAAEPWPGDVAVYDASSDVGYALNTLITTGSTVGRLTTPLRSARPGLYDIGAVLDVALSSGALSSVSEASLLMGANMAAIGPGAPDAWEIIQFRNAELTGPNRWRLTHLLRGQFGTDAFTGTHAAEDTYFVLLDTVSTQIDLAANLRGQVRHYRIGPANKPHDRGAYRHSELQFEGNGLRPYSPVHLTTHWRDGDLHVAWVRRSRLDADDWSQPDIPLGEDTEAHRISITLPSGGHRQAEVTTPAWVYTTDMQATDGFAGGGTASVAQISARFGAGPAARLNISV